MTSNFPHSIKISTLKGVVKDYFKFTISDNTTTYAVEAKFIHLLSSALRFEYSIISPEDNQMGFSLANGNWTGIIGMVKEQEVDMAVNMVAISEERSKVVDFSYPYYITDVTFLTHPLQPLPKSFVIFYPFSFQLWIILAVFILSMSFIFYVLKSAKGSYSHALLVVLGSVIGKTITLNISAAKRWLTMSFWLFGVMFIKYSYEATLLSFLSFPPMEGIHNIVELARGVEEDSYKCVTFKGSYIISQLLESKDRNYRIIGRSLQENSKGNMLHNMEMLSKVKKSAFVTTRQILLTIGDTYYVSQDSFSMIMLGIAIKKTFCCKNTLNKVVRRIFEAGLYEKTLNDRDTITFIKEGSKHNRQSEKQRIITLDDTIGAFYILIIGQTLAIIACFIECIVGKKLKIFK